MLEGKLKTGVEDIYLLRTQLGEVVEKLNDSELRKYLTFFLDTLLLPIEDSISNIKKRGIYRALLLGMDNFDVINKILGGIRQSSIITDQTSCLIEIEKVFSKEAQKVTFRFVDDADGILKSNEALLRRVFKRYMPDIDFEGIQQIRPLIISDMVNLLESPHEDIQRILGIEGLVSAIGINYCSPTNESVYTHINRLTIVTEKYLAIHSHDLEKQSDRGIISEQFYSPDFVGLFNRTNGSNFFILNSENDFLINIYVACIKRYLKTFQTGSDLDKPLANSLISAVFSLTSTRYITERYVNEHPDFKNILPVGILSTDLEYRHLPSTMTIILSILLAITMRKRTEIGNKWDSMPEKIKKMEQKLSSESRIVNSHSNKIIIIFDELKKSIDGLEVFNQKKMPADRAPFFAKYNDCLISLFSFIKAYCIEKENLGIETNEDFQKNQLLYLEKTKFPQCVAKIPFISQIYNPKYVKRDEEFREYITGRLENLRKILPSLRESVQISSFNSLVSDVNGFIVDLSGKVSKQNIEYSLSLLGNRLSSKIIDLIGSAT